MGATDPLQAYLSTDRSWQILSRTPPMPPFSHLPLQKMSNNKQQGDFNMSDLGPALPAATAALSAEDRADLVNALKNKLQNLAGQHSDVLETLSPNVRKRVEVLREIQMCMLRKHDGASQMSNVVAAISEHDELEAKFFEERAALEAKYQKLYEPLYTKRYDIVNGVVEVEVISSETTDGTPEDDKSVEEKGVPSFWLNAMKTNEVLADEITERDEGALKYLKDIKWCRIDSPKGFKIEFIFDTNPYFMNSVLTKTYHMIDDDEPILEKAIGTEIEWYPGKCLTQKVLKKKPRKGSKNAKPVTKTEDCDSFFNFFNPPQVPEDDEDIDEETAEELQNQMEQDYDIGSTIRDKIIPHAVSWFTGEAVQGEDFDEIEGDDDDDDVEEEEDEDEEDDEDDEDDEDEEDCKRKKKKSSGAAKLSEGLPDEKPPECKQQ
ncbi:Nucleosome assembly protein [Asimina triloba]